MFPIDILDVYTCAHEHQYDIMKKIHFAVYICKTGCMQLCTAKYVTTTQ